MVLVYEELTSKILSGNYSEELDGVQPVGLPPRQKSFRRLVPQVLRSAQTRNGSLHEVSSKTSNPLKSRGTPLKGKVGEGTKGDGTEVSQHQFKFTVTHIFPELRLIPTSFIIMLFT